MRSASIAARLRGSLWFALAIVSLALGLWLGSGLSAKPAPIRTGSELPLADGQSSPLLKKAQDSASQNLAPSTSVASGYRTQPTPIAPSLLGTEADGELRFQHARLVPDVALRRRFDYHLSAIGEFSMAQIRARFAADLAGLDAGQRQQVLLAFERYIELLSEFDRRSWQFAGLSPEQQLASLSALRKERLGEETAAAFFLRDEQRAAHALAERALLQLRLDPETRSETLSTRRAQLRAELPPELQSELSEADLSESDALVQAASSDAATGARVHALAIERERWQLRVQAYRQFEASLKLRPELARRRELDRYLASEFLPAERRRIESLAAIGQLEASLHGP